MVGINPGGCHKGAITLFFSRPEELSTYSIKLITQAVCVELTLYLTRSKLHLRVLKQPYKSRELKKQPVAMQDPVYCTPALHLKALFVLC